MHVCVAVCVQCGGGYTPIHLAALKGKFDTVKLLLAVHVQSMSASDDLPGFTSQWGQTQAGESPTCLFKATRAASAGTQLLMRVMHAKSSSMLVFAGGSCLKYFHVFEGGICLFVYAKGSCMPSCM